MHCKFCGKEIDNDSLFCMFCGNRLIKTDVYDYVPPINLLLTKTSKEDKDSATRDNYGVLYSRDGERLISQKQDAEISEYSVKIGTKVICDFAFKIPTYGDYKGLTKINISQGVTLIGASAFAGNSLVNVAIPNSVIVIKDRAFRDCTSLKQISFGNSIKFIGLEAFAGCGSLTDVAIPRCVEKIGNRAFAWCKKIVRFNVDEDNENYCSKNGVLYSKDMTRLIQFPAASSVMSYNIPNSVTSIGDRAFDGCTGLTSITIPESVTEIGCYAFSGCSALTAVTIPKSVTVIGSGAFSGCKELIEVFISDGVAILGYSAFSGCANLRQVTLPKRIKKIDNSTFSDCKGLLQITIPENITYIGDKAFYQCTNLRRIVLPDGVTRISQYSFYGCIGLTQVAIPDSVTTIDSHAFYGCTSLTSVTMPESVTSIGDSAFRDCTGLSEMTVPNSVTMIDDYAFRGCKGLTSITFPNSVTTIGNGAFEECTGLTSVVIPESVTELGGCAFQGCINLRRIVLPNSITEINYGTFESCTILTEISIPSHIEKIGRCAFSHCEKLKTIIIPKSVVSIEDCAFVHCSDLEEVTIGAGLKKIERDTFHKCTKFKKLFIEDTNEPLDVTGLFLNTSLECLYLGRELKCQYVYRDDFSPFKMNKNLRSLTIGKNVTSIANHAFDGCTGLTEVTIPESITIIGDRAFANCTGLTEVNFNAISCKSAGKYYFSRAYEGCTNISNITIGDEVTIIPDNLFVDCANLKKVSIPNSVTDIGECAFGRCTGLEDVIIGCGVKKIRWRAFELCTNLLYINLPDGLQSIGKNAFNGCTKLSGIRIPLSVNEIHIEAFAGCENLINIIVDGRDVDFSSTIYSNNKDCETIFIWGIPDMKLFFSSLITYKNLRFIKSLKYPSVVLDLKKGRKKHEINLMQNAIEYHKFGMNLTQMCWDYAKKEKSYKDPIDDRWRNWMLQEQEQCVLESWKWDGVVGCGLVLGYNCYRAIDVDDIYTVDGNGKLQSTIDYKKIIEDFCHFLNLPCNYPWVVLSGSGKGFHIIFKADSLEQNFDSMSFQANDEFKEVKKKGYGFKRIELRWQDHLVLPPSFHSSGNKYKFFCNEIPSVPPQKLSINDIDNFLEIVSGESVFITYKYNMLDIPLAKRKKIFCRHDSWLPSKDYNEDSISWLKSCNSSSAYNSLAIDYVLGERVETDPAKAFHLFTASKSQDAFFNIASLISCGFLTGDFKDVQYCLSRLDNEKYNKHVNQIVDDASSNLKPGILYLFFDTETTGLPQKYNVPSSDVNNWPRIVQLSWIVANSHGDILSKENHIIYPIDFAIPQEATITHNITTQRAKLEGTSISDVMDKFVNDLNHCDYLVGHNVDFDMKVAGAELIRLGQIDVISSKNAICTMQKTVDYCKIRKGLFDYKYPKLQELYYKLFNCHFEGGHNSVADVEATFKCFWELKRRNVI